MTANGQKFATASLVTEDTKGFSAPPMTLEKINELLVIAESYFSDLWHADDAGRILNKFGYVVATFEQRTDAFAFAQFSPEIIQQILLLAKETLEAKKPGPVKAPAKKTNPEE